MSKDGKFKDFYNLASNESTWINTLKQYEEQTNTNITNTSEDQENENILNISSVSLFFEERYNEEEPTRNRT
jgi:hypothetical protein